ncbi:hypothetical protein KZ829_24540 [Actinoplanes hulinensis]|uniref:Uncharacterized protein n=1 Tax=Actinoplanes hulinensis TaxID=1144547 RepID=A0ABS7B784_9ACTN|nr:hypothetical protein [Actinoplanes hulinensis]MBW6436915.1 hypothetical protein [Actinoplanes hulinensis]
MCAAVVTVFDRSLGIREVAVPEPGRSEVLCETRQLDEINDSIEDVLARLVMLP